MCVEFLENSEIYCMCCRGCQFYLIWRNSGLPLSLERAHSIPSRTTKKACHLYKRDDRPEPSAVPLSLIRAVRLETTHVPDHGGQPSRPTGCWILGILISLTAPGRVLVTFRLCFHQAHSSLSETKGPYYSRSLRLKVLIVIIIRTFGKVNTVV